MVPAQENSGVFYAAGIERRVGDGVVVWTWIATTERFVLSTSWKQFLAGKNLPRQPGTYRERLAQIDHVKMLICPGQQIGPREKGLVLTEKDPDGLPTDAPSSWPTQSQLNGWRKRMC